MEENKLKMINVPPDPSGQIVLALVNKDFKPPVGSDRKEYLKNAVFTGTGKDNNEAIADLTSNLGVAETSSMAGGAIAGGPGINGGPWRKRDVNIPKTTGFKTLKKGSKK